MSEQTPRSEVFEAYLDGQLLADQHAEVDDAVEQNMQLQSQVTLQRQIDASLKQLFIAPAASNAWDEMAVGSPRWSLGGRWRIAAAVLLLASVVGAGLWLVRDSRDSALRPGFEAMQIYYDKALAAGFEPEWVCEDDHEFAQTFDYRFDQPMRVGELPLGVELLGLGYGRVLSPQTVVVFGRVQGQGVLVFVNPLHTAGEPLPLAAGLNRFERCYGHVILHEVSPLEESHLIGHFFSIPRNETDDSGHLGGEAGDVPAAGDSTESR